MLPLVLVGAVMIVSGVTFFLQGIGVLQGSSMSSTVTWSILGPLIAAAGAALVRYARRAAAEDAGR